MGFARPQGVGRPGGIGSPQGTGTGIAPAQGAEGSAAAFSPSDIAGLSPWFKADVLASLWQDSARTTPVAANSDPVGAWDDQKTSVNALQATAGARPLYKTNIQNGLPGILADGVDDLLSAVFVKVQPVTVFLVGKMLSANAAQAVFVYDGAGGPAVQKAHGAGTVWDIYSGTFLDSATATDALAHTFVAIFNGATSKLRLDGTEIASGDANTAGFANLSLFGASLMGNGYLHEFGVYDTVLSAGNLANVETYCKGRWATP